MDIKDFKDFIGIGITGILGVLWWDLRNIRKDRDVFSNDMKKDYMSKEVHELTCKAVSLQINEDMRKHIDDKFDDLKEFINANGFKR